MLLHPFRQIAQSSDALLKEQFASLRTQVPMMYALLFLDAVFLGIATYGEVPDSHSLGVPALLCVAIAVRIGMWIYRRPRAPTSQQIRRYLYGALISAMVMSATFSAWCLMLLAESGPARGTAVALYVFVAVVSCCFCLQALPAAGRIVVLFGALPITIMLLFSNDWYLAVIAISFVFTGAGILRVLGTSHAAFLQALQARSEMSDLIAALRRSEEHYRNSVDLNPQIPWTADATGAVTELSPRWAALTGIPLADSLADGWAAAAHPDDLPAVWDVWSRALETKQGAIADTRFRLRRHDGSYRWYRSRAWPFVDATGEVRTWYGILEDIHDQVLAESALQETEERYRLASLAANDVIWDLSMETMQIVWSGAVADVLGYPETQAGTSVAWWVDRTHPDDREDLKNRVNDLIETGATFWSNQFRFLAANGSYLNLRARGNVARDAAGKPTRLIGTLQDVTAQTQYEEKLRWAAHCDPLTRLPNRILFGERLEAAFRDARNDGRSVGLIVLDLDRFKIINDSLGHDTGDAALREVASRLTQSAPAGATVARLGGDEFAIILPDVDRDGGNIAMIDALLADACRPMIHAGRQIEISLSAGLAVAFDDGECVEELHKSADLALYAAKRESPGRLRRFHRELRDAAERDKRMLAKAREALRDERIVPFYQPKVCLRTGSLLGFEALLRWHDGERGILLPGAIGAAFEDAGISVHITDRMLDCTIRDMVDWQDRGIAFGRIAINGSPEDFRRGDFADRVLGRLQRAGLPASLLELEVTESVFMGQLAANVSAALNTLSQAGVTIALDDFGTGYASLTHLKQFPVDTLKIDRSFVSKLDLVETEDEAIVGAVIDLARNLQITTVAEGVETRAQAAHLLVRGCDAAQGFLFGRAIPGAKLPGAASGWDQQAALALCASDWGAAVRQVHRDRFP